MVTVERIQSGIMRTNIFFTIGAAIGFGTSSIIIGKFADYSFMFMIGSATLTLFNILNIKYLMK